MTTRSERIETIAKALVRDARVCPTAPRCSHAGCVAVEAFKAALATESAPTGEVRLVERSEDGKRGYAQGYTAGVTASISACLMEPPERQSTIGTLVLERASDRIAALLSALPAPSPTPVADDDAPSDGCLCQPGCAPGCPGCDCDEHPPAADDALGRGKGDQS